MRGFHRALFIGSHITGFIHFSYGAFSILNKKSARVIPRRR